MKNQPAMVIEPLESRIAPANAAFYHDLSNDLKTKLDSIQSVIDTAVGAGTLIPVVGDKIAAAGKVIDNFSAQLKSAIDLLSPDAIDDDVRSALFNLLRPDAANPVPVLRLLADNNGDGTVTKDDVIITHPDAHGASILIDISLHAAVGVSASLAFDVGLGSLPIHLESNAAVQASATLDYQHLTFGLSETSGFLFHAGTVNELKVGISAGLVPQAPGTPDLIATIGFLRATISDDPAHPTQLSASLVVDLKEKGAPTVDFDASADVNLKLDAGFGEAFPSIAADFEFHYGGLKAGDAAPTVAFKHVSIDLGNAVSSILEPVFKNLAKVLTPVQPVVDFITAPIPVISDLSHAIGAGNISILDIANAGSGELPADYQNLFKLVSTVAQIVELAGKFKSSADAHKAMIDLGDFTALVEGNAGADLRSAGKALDLATAGNAEALSSLVPGGFAANFDIKAKIEEAASKIPGLQGSQLITDLETTLDEFLHPNGITYSFPFLRDPAGSIFGMLLGRDADLFTLDAKLKASASFSHTYPVAFGIDVGFEGAASIDLELHLGYDTYGVREFAKDAINNGGVTASTVLDFFDGLYMRDTTHAILKASIAATAGIDVVIASVDVKGGVALDVELTPPTGMALHEVDGDVTKIHLRPELTNALFITQGSLDAFLDLEAKVGIGPFHVSKSFELAHVRLLDFGGGIIPNPFTPPPDLHLASTHADDASIPAGTMRLNIGQAAQYRGVSPGEITEDYQIFPGAEPNTVVVLGFGYIQTFTGVHRIIGDGGSGNDHVVFQSGAGRQITANVDLDGGDGDDQLVYHGSGRATLRGGPGKDVLAGGNGTNYLNGGEGDDQLTGGAGVNHLGAFTLQGQIFTEEGNDTLLGGDGPNTLNGGGGDDALYAGKSAHDLLFGGTGNDQLTAGSGRAAFYGGTGDDTFLWHAGNGQPLVVDGGSDRENNTMELTGGDFADSFALSRNSTDPRLQVGVTNPEQNFDFLAHGFRNVFLEGGKGADRLTVASLTGRGVRQVGLNLSDVLRDQLHAGDGVADVLTVIGSAGADKAKIEAEQVVINEHVHGDATLGGIMKVTGLDLYQVRLANVDDSFTYQAAGGDDVTTLLSNTGPTRLLGGAGNDLFTLAAQHPGDPVNPANPFNPKDYLAPVQVDAGAGANRIVFDESAAALPETVILGAAQYSSSLLPAASFTATGGSFSGVTVRGGLLGDTIHVVATLPGAKTAIFGGAGDDVITIGAGSLNAILGPLQVEAGAGANQLHLLDSGDLNGNSHSVITSTQIAGLAGAGDTVSVQYAATGGALGITIEGSGTAADRLTLLSPQAKVTINGNGGNDVVNALSLSQELTFAGGGGDDRLTLGATLRTLAGLKAPVTFQGGAGQDALLLDDSLNPTARTYNLLAGTIFFSGMASAEIDLAVEKATVLGGEGADEFAVNGLPGVPASIELRGGAGANHLTGPAANNVWTLDSADAGTLNGLIHFAQMPNLTGGVFSDRFTLANGQGLHGHLDGGNGVDTLDYTAWTGPVTVNLGLGQASGNSGGLASIENVTGGQGADVLVGNGAANLLIGGPGRNILIGGQAGDTLLGGTEEDLLIGGTTDFDAKPAALTALAKIWAGPGDYLSRIAHLTLSNQPGATILTGATVHDDMFADTITGGAEARDWFFARLLAGGTDNTDFNSSTERNG